MKEINEKRNIDHTYIAGLHNEKVIVYGFTIAEAKQKAIEYFKPKKKDRGLVWIVLDDTTNPEVF